MKTHEELDERVNGGDLDESEISFRLLTCEATMRKSELCKTLLSLSFLSRVSKQNMFWVIDLFSLDFTCLIGKVHYLI